LLVSWSWTIQQQWIVQKEKELLIVQELDQQTRHICVNVPNSSNPKLSWHGESIGHFEGDEAVVPTIAMPKVASTITAHPTPIRSPSSKIIETGKTLQITTTDGRR
jgi:uncharacterized membrane protein